MKKITSIFLISSILISVLFITGCKNGDKDPFFSFRTRKQRVSGEWDITVRRDSLYTIYNSGLYERRHLSIDGTKVTEEFRYQRLNDDDSTIVWTGDVKDEYYDFDKNGNMTYILDYTLKHKWAQRTDENTNMTYDSTITRNHRWVNRGTWNFLANIDGYKNKERIALVYESTEYRSSIDTMYVITDPNTDPIKIDTYHYPTYESEVFQYANGEMAELWELKELKYKEIIMRRNIDEVYTLSLIHI